MHISVFRELHLTQKFTLSFLALASFMFLMPGLGHFASVLISFAVIFTLASGNIFGGIVTASNKSYVALAAIF